MEGSSRARHFDASQISHLCALRDLIERLELAFASMSNQPARQHICVSEHKDFLVMPAIGLNEFFGAKLVSVFQANPKQNLPSVQGIYCLFEKHTGRLIATMDASELTARRTAAASALASKLLSRPASKQLAILGTGKLAPYFAAAHACVRDIESIALWGRNLKKADRLANSISQQTDLKVFAKEQALQAIEGANIISTLTSSSHPILFGDDLKPGMHLDLVGAHKPSMREADIACFDHASVFVDTVEGCTNEAGDLIDAMSALNLGPQLIAADLSSLCSRAHPGRKSTSEITLFKSVGCAYEDLVAAILVFESAQSV